MSLVDSRSEELLRAALGEEANPEAPQSRVEKILASIAGEEVQLDEPQSRVEVLLKALAESGGGGSGGLEYESGEWRQSSNNMYPTQNPILFSKTHSKPPFLAIIYDSKNYSSVSSARVSLMAWFDMYGLSNTYMQVGQTDASTKYGGLSLYACTDNSKALNWITYGSDREESGSSTTRWVMTETGINVRNNPQKFVSGHTYKWLAIWAPET